MDDFKYAIRQWQQNPGFTLMAILVLALSIGTSTSMFSLINGILLKPIPYREPDQLVRLYQKYQERQFIGNLPLPSGRTLSATESNSVR
ncbi:MAG: hypothetical protein M2R45_03243 [Verrucomicrobia subdivision 3 bacterium]|nr:hypothetical protein [Limisphaerales bacterium]MCS1416104.1 hypothetical protein [Limisphaerales bacterium]